MKILIALSVLVFIQAAAGFKWETCEQTPYARLNTFEISPDPLKFPGQVSYNIDAELLKDVKDVSMTLKIVRETFFLDITLPCAKQIGSCSYTNLCSFFKDMYVDDWGNIGKNLIGNALSKEGITGEAAQRAELIQKTNEVCQNGVKAQRIKRSGVINVPKLPGILSFFIGGDYSVQMKMTDNSDGSTLACVKGSIELD